MTCAEARTELGVYVLGALEPAERQALDEHLAGCPGCRDELSTLAGLPGLLSRLDPAEVVGGPPRPSSELYDRLRARAGAANVRWERRRRLLAVAAAVVLGGAGLGVGLGLAHSPSARPAAAWTVTDASTHVTGHFTVSGGSGGSQITLAISHVPPSERCELVAIGRDGSMEIAGSWVASYEGVAVVHASVAMAPARLEALRVQTFGGRPLVTLNLPRGA